MQTAFDFAAKAANHDRVITLNCGMGRDSLTMLVLLFEGELVADLDGRKVKLGPKDIDCVVFADTGAEWAHTYALLGRIRQLCADHGVRFIVLEKDDGHGSSAQAPAEITDWADIEVKAFCGGYHVRPKRGGGKTVMAPIMKDLQSRATVVSLGKGDCTDNHKIQPIRRLINDLAVLRFGVGNRSWAAKSAKRPKHVTIIGIAADETSRLANGGRGPAYVTEAYPLITMGIAKAGEAAHLGRWGLGHVRKSGCILCPYQPISWYWALSQEAPDTYAQVVEYERIALERNPRMFATGAKKTIPEAVGAWRAANPTATVAAVLDKEYDRCPAMAA